MVICFISFEKYSTSNCWKYYKLRMIFHYKSANWWRGIRFDWLAGSFTVWRFSLIGVILADKWRVHRIIKIFQAFCITLPFSTPSGSCFLLPFCTFVYIGIEQIVKYDILGAQNKVFVFKWYTVREWSPFYWFDYLSSFMVNDNSIHPSWCLCDFVDKWNHALFG